MHHFGRLAIVLLLASCNSAGLPNGVGGGGGGGGNGDGSSTVGDGGPGSQVDMTPPNQGTDGTGVQGAKCQTACDCEPGLACRQGKCGNSMVGKVYCCDGATCPMGSFCQSKDGNVGRCGDMGGGGGGPGGGGGGGGGGPAFCTMVPCQSATGCQQIGCGACNMTTKTCTQ